MERRNTPRIPGIEVRMHDEGKRIVGHAAVFYREGDLSTQYQLWAGAVERIMPGAFDRALKDGDDVRGLFNHNPNHVLGRTASGTMKLSVDDRGLAYDIEPGDTSVAKDVREHLSRGDVDGSSFGFRVEEEEWTTEDVAGVTIEVRNIKSVQLHDVGPVTFPAYAGADSGTRSLEDAKEARDAWAKAQKPDIDPLAAYRHRIAISATR